MWSLRSLLISLVHTLLDKLSTKHLQFFPLIGVSIFAYIFVYVFVFKSVFVSAFASASVAEIAMDLRLQHPHHLLKWLLQCIDRHHCLPI